MMWGHGVWCMYPSPLTLLDPVRTRTWTVSSWWWIPWPTMRSTARCRRRGGMPSSPLLGRVSQGMTATATATVVGLVWPPSEMVMRALLRHGGSPGDRPCSRGWWVLLLLLLPPPPTTTRTSTATIHLLKCACMSVLPQHLQGPTCSRTPKSLCRYREGVSTHRPDSDLLCPHVCCPL